MKAQIITNETDALVAILLTDMYGVLDSQMFATPTPSSATFTRHIKVRLAVGRAYVEAEYDGTSASGTKTLALDTADDIPFVPFEIQGVTYRRLPMTDDEGSIAECERGTFPIFVMKVPRGTFEVSGDVKVALCEVFTSGSYSGGQEVWQKYGETMIKMQAI